MATKRIFHYGKGFDKYTWCGIKTKALGEAGPGPDWGGCITSGTTCKKCIQNYISQSAYGIEQAIKQLRALDKK